MIVEADRLDDTQVRLAEEDVPADDRVSPERGVDGTDGGGHAVAARGPLGRVGGGRQPILRENVLLQRGTAASACGRGPGRRTTGRRSRRRGMGGACGVRRSLRRMERPPRMRPARTTRRARNSGRGRRRKDPRAWVAGEGRSRLRARTKRPRRRQGPSVSSVRRGTSLRGQRP